MTTLSTIAVALNLGMAATLAVRIVRQWREDLRDKARVARALSETMALAAMHAQACHDLGVEADSRPSAGAADGENCTRALIARTSEWLGFEPKYPTPADVRAEWRKAHALVEARQREIQEAVRQANVEKAEAQRMQFRTAGEWSVARAERAKLGSVLSGLDERVAACASLDEAKAATRDAAAAFKAEFSAGDAPDPADGSGS